MLTALTAAILLLCYRWRLVLSCSNGVLSLCWAPYLLPQLRLWRGETAHPLTQHLAELIADAMNNDASDSNRTAKRRRRRLSCGRAVIGAVQAEKWSVLLRPGQSELMCRISFRLLRLAAVAAVAAMKRRRTKWRHRNWRRW